MRTINQQIDEEYKDYDSNLFVNIQICISFLLLTFSIILKYLWDQ